MNYAVCFLLNISSVLQVKEGQFKNDFKSSPEFLTRPLHCLRHYCRTPYPYYI